MRLKASTLAIALAAGSALAALSLPAFGQDSPESLLPEGFGDPVPVPTPPPPPELGQPGPTQPADPNAPRLPPLPGATVDDADTAEAIDEDSDPLDDLEIVAGDEGEIPLEYELPPGARRSLALVGPLTPRNGGYGEQAFAGVDGRVLETLMRRLDAPGPSRWLHITLRRALLSNVPTPPLVSAPDWTAERAWLMLRMGEADGARLLVQRVDSNRYTPKLYAVAMQTALANSDPAALCPLLSGARAASDAPGWVLAAAICDGLEGESATASAQMDVARANRITNDFDILLAARVVGAGATGRSVPVEWEGAGRLSAWRFGLAGVVGQQVPEPLYDAAGRQVDGWRARTPTIALADRIAPAMRAAAMGVLSNATLVDLYSARYPELEPFELSGSPFARLRSAYVRTDFGERMAALRALWDEDGAPDRYPTLILTARAAALIPPDSDYAGDAVDLIASMLSTGLDRNAARWAPVVAEMETEAADEAWALLAVGAPEGTVPVALGRIESYARRAGAQGRHRAGMLAAALSGLGRLDRGDQSDAGEQFGFSIAADDSWSRQIDRAARAGSQGRVALLAAIGMQTRSWRGVPPGQLFHAVRALRLVGLEGEARMIAAEAITRL